MRIFLTGATGYIGSALCRRWADEGHDLRALVRSSSSAGELESLGVRLFRGDVTERESMREGMSGADWVIHAAAELDMRVSPGWMRRVNSEGSAHVATLALEAGVGGLLAISSIAAFGGSPNDGSPVGEEASPRLPFPGAYGASKHDGAEAIRECAARGLRVNIVYPSLVYGPPGKRRGANAVLRQIALGRLPAVVGARRTARWVYLDDLIDGITTVIDRAPPDRHYLMTGDLTSVGSLVERVCRLAGIAPPRLRLSPVAANPLLRALGLLSRLRGRRAPFVREQLASLRRHWNFDDARARRELEWEPRTLDNGLPPTVEHLLRK